MTIAQKKVTDDDSLQRRCEAEVRVDRKEMFCLPTAAIPFRVLPTRDTLVVCSFFGFQTSR